MPGLTIILLAYWPIFLLIFKWRSTFDSQQDFTLEDARRHKWRVWGAWVVITDIGVAYVLASVVTTRQSPDAAPPPASSAGRCRPSAAPRVPSANGLQDIGQPQ